MLVFRAIDLCPLLALSSLALFFITCSDGLQWANFDVWPGPSRRSLQDASRRSLQDEKSAVQDKNSAVQDEKSAVASVHGGKSPYTADDLYHSEGLIWERCPDLSDIVGQFWRRIVSPPPLPLPSAPVIRK